MNNRESKYVTVVDAVIMQGRNMVETEDAAAFAGPYSMTSGGHQGSMNGADRVVEPGRSG